MPQSVDSREEGEVQLEERAELKELNAALKVLLDFQSENPSAHGYAPDEAQKMLALAKKHNESIAKRSEKILERLHNKALCNSQFSAFLMKEEDSILIITLNINSHIVLIMAQLERLLELSVQGDSMGIKGKLRPFRVKILQEAVNNLERLIDAVRGLVALEEDLKCKI